ncbi:hypothetical protein KYE_15873 [Marinobacter manganoxydans MnI7-9]|uniref:Uncharacterized protein n=1 Tax=Marinobacter manganoxydans MnI7-9 TaxID=1094979 RepID=G6YWB5_9GAMM|nr:hypothetical protein KYE_15873 [Marinobacter manganoxydans MnI7-9]
MCSHRFEVDRGEFVISAAGSLSLAKKCHPFIKRIDFPSEDRAGLRSVKQRFWTPAVSIRLQSSQQPLNQGLKHSTIFRAPLGLNNQKRRMV